MALQPHDLDGPRAARPPLRLVAPPRRPEGRPLAAALLVICVAAALGWPAFRAAAADAELRPWSPRALPAASTTRLDPLNPLPPSAQPKSREPVGGMVFVSCTHLWTARADGSHARRLLQVPGVSSPAFAPNARTIAFFASTDEGEQGLFLVGADGSGLVRAGALTEAGFPIRARAGALTWSPDGGRLGFALTSDDADEFSGGSAIFSFDLSTGEFEETGSGWPAPFWIKDRLVYSEWVEAEGPRFGGEGSRRIERTISTRAGDFSADFVSPRWRDYRGDIATLGLAPHESRTRLYVRDGEWQRRSRESYLPPAGYSFAPHARPSLSEDSAFVLVELRDSGGGRDLGLLDRATGRWDVRNYAWEPDASTAPAVTGPIASRRAAQAVDTLLRAWDKQFTRRLLAGPQPRSLLPFRDIGHTRSAPERSGDGWVVETVAWGRGKDEGSWGYRTLSVAVRERDGRLTAVPAATSPVEPVETIDDAVRFLRRVVSVEFVPPAGLPPGTKLSSRDPVAAYSWGGQTTGWLNLEVPRAGSGGSKFSTMRISYGENYFDMGCGGVKGEATAVGDETAVAGDLGRAHQIIWPAHTKEGDKWGVHGPRTYSVYGRRVPATMVRAVAEAMEASS